VEKKAFILVHVNLAVINERKFAAQAKQWRSIWWLFILDAKRRTTRVKWMF